MKNCHITAKLGTMRKAVDWIVYPQTDQSGRITIQSDSRICCFFEDTGLGMLSKAGRPYFIDLARVRGATPVEVPKDVIEAAKAAMPKSGDTVAPGLVIA